MKIELRTTLSSQQCVKVINPKELCVYPVRCLSTVQCSTIQSIWGGASPGTPPLLPHRSPPPQCACPHTSKCKSCADAKRRASAFGQALAGHISKLRAEPSAYGGIGVAELLGMREECLREFGFRDAYRSLHCCPPFPAALGQANVTWHEGSFGCF